MRKKHFIVVLAILLPVLITSSIYISQQTICKTFTPFNPNLALTPTNYSIGVLPNEEYTWIITALRENNLELGFGSNWTDVFGLCGAPQRGHKFKVNITSTQSNGTHYLIDYNEWDCLYRLSNFSIAPDRSCNYEYPIHPQNYADSFELASVFPLFFPTPLASYVYDSNLNATYYRTYNVTGSGLYVTYDRQTNINGYPIHLEGLACYHENGALDFFRFFYINGSEEFECLTIEAFELYHLEQASMGCQGGEEFTWVLVNYNLTALEYFFGDEFFEKYGLLPHPERMQSIKLKVDGVSENDTDWQVDYSLYNWTSLDDNFSESSVKNSSYAFTKEPFNESRSYDGQIPFLIPEPTELFLRYGRFGDRYGSYGLVDLSFSIGLETLSGKVFYNRAGVLTTMIFSRNAYIGGRTELQIAFEIALYYDSPTPDYVGIEEGAQFHYDIYTNETMGAYIVIPTKYYQNATLEILHVFGEEKSLGRTPFVANFCLQGIYDIFEFKDLLIVGYVHNDSNMYFDPLVVSGLNPFFLAPLFVNNRMNWTEFAANYISYSGLITPHYFSVSELENGFTIHQGSSPYSYTYSYVYNETGFLSEYIIYYNDQLYHYCTLEGNPPPPIVVDTDPPVITVLNPIYGDLCGTTPPEYNLTVEEAHLNCTWLTISNGTVEYVQELSLDSSNSIVSIAGQISESAWNFYSDGNLTLKFWANDSFGNLNWKEITVIKDATAPTISVLNLISGKVYNNTAPEFELLITEFHLNCTWYTVNGSEIVYFSGTSGTIDQAIWGGLSNGSVLVQFFALDDVDNLGTVEVEISKIVKSESELPSQRDSNEFNLSGITISFTIVLLAGCVYVIIVTRKRN